MLSSEQEIVTVEQAKIKELELLVKDITTFLQSNFTKKQDENTLLSLINKFFDLLHTVYQKSILLFADRAFTTEEQIDIQYDLYEILFTEPLWHNEYSKSFLITLYAIFEGISLSIDGKIEETLASFLLIPEKYIFTTKDENDIDRNLFAPCKQFLANTLSKHPIISAQLCYLDIKYNHKDKDTIITRLEYVGSRYSLLKNNDVRSQLNFIQALVYLSQKIKETLNEPAKIKHFFSLFKQDLATNNQTLPLTNEKANIIQKIMKELAIVQSEEDKDKTTLTEYGKILAHKSILEIIEAKHISSDDLCLSKILFNFIYNELHELSSTLKLFTSTTLANCSISLADEKDEYSLIKLFLEKDEGLQYRCANLTIEIITEIQAEKTLITEKNEMSLPLYKSPGHLDLLKQLERQIREIQHLENQAAFKHKVCQAKYTLTAEEIALICEITEIHEEISSISHLEALILEKKAKVTRENCEGVSKMFPKRTDYFDLALDYLDYQQKRYDQIINPEKRLNPNGELGKHRHLTSTKDKRKVLFKKIDSLLYLPGKNLELKKLKQFLLNKINFAENLKNQTSIFNNNNMILQCRLDIANSSPQLFEPRQFKNLNYFFKPRPNSEAVRLIYTLQNLQNLRNEIVNFEPNSNTQITFTTENELFKQEQLSTNLLFLKTKLQKPFSVDIQTSKNGKQQISLKEIQSLISLVDEQILLLKKQILKQPLRSYQNAFKILFEQNFTQLADSTKVPTNFLPDREDALNQIGRMLTRAKEAKSRLELNAATYLAIIDLNLLAKNEVSDILKKLANFQPKQIISELTNIIENLKKHHLDHFAQTTLMTDPIYIAESKRLELVASLEHIQSCLEHTDLSACLEANQQQINDLNTEKGYASSIIKKMLLTANDMLASFTYIADHCTSQLNGKR